MSSPQEIPKEPSGLFKPGPGLLARVQKAKVTLHGLAVSKSMVDHLLTETEVTEIKSKPDVKKTVFLDAPFNLLSVINEHLGIGG